MKQHLVGLIVASLVVLGTLSPNSHAKNGTLIVKGHVDVTAPNPNQTFYCRGIWGGAWTIPAVIPESSLHSVSAKVPFNDSDPNMEPMMVIIRGALQPE
jgi:hypothetical protein